MIEVIEGKGVGAGKSYFAVDRLLPHWMRGGTACVSDTVEIKWKECCDYAKKRAGVILEADQYRPISSADLQRLHEVTPPGSVDLPVLIIVDEAQDAFNARDWSDKSKRPFFSWLCQSRHDDNDVIILSQAAANVDKQVRRLCTYIWIVRNTEYFPVGGVNVGGKPASLMHWFRWLSLGFTDGRFFIRTQLDQDGKTRLSRNWIKADRGLFGCYESKAMRMKHRRSGEAVLRKKLEKDQNHGRKKMFKYAFVGALIAIAFGGYHVVTGGWFGGGKKKVAASAPAAQVEKFRNGQVVREELRASMPGYLQTVERVYEQGASNDLGRVVMVTRDRAVIELRKGLRIVVEAFSGRPEGSVAGGATGTPAPSFKLVGK